MNDRLELKSIDTATAAALHERGLDAFTRMHALDPRMRALAASYDRFIEPTGVALVAAAQIAAALLMVFGA